MQTFPCRTCPCKGKFTSNLQLARLSVALRAIPLTSSRSLNSFFVAWTHMGWAQRGFHGRKCSCYSLQATLTFWWPSKISSMPAVRSRRNVRWPRYWTVNSQLLGSATSSAHLPVMNIDFYLRRRLSLFMTTFLHWTWRWVKYSWEFLTRLTSHLSDV